jgi:hypothetical protein
MKSIILGLFMSIYSYGLKKRFNASTYPFWDNDVLSAELVNGTAGILEVVKLALSRCYFVLDGIKFPFNSSTNSWTCHELLYILDNPIYLEKVVFVLDNKELSENEALTYLGRADLITNL